VLLLSKYVLASSVYCLLIRVQIQKHGFYLSKYHQLIPAINRLSANQILHVPQLVSAQKIAYNLRTHISWCGIVFSEKKLAKECCTMTRINKHDIILILYAIRDLI